MNRENQDWMKTILAVMAVVIIGVLVFHMISVASFNQHEYRVNGADESQTSYMTFHNREDSTSTWVKRDFELNGEKVDLLAQTFDATLYNRSSYEISTWALRIDIKSDCFINNAWCGSMEIHQYTGSDREKVQKLDLRDYDLEDVEVDYLYDGDLLIPLVKGDYLLYYPSVKDTEFPVKGGSELTVGMIFYYLDSIDLSDYMFTYRYYEKYTEGTGFYVVIVLLMLWIILFTAQTVSTVSYQRAWKDMEMRKSGISYMSDIYENIYIIDLENDEMIPLHRATESERIMMRNAGAREHLLSLLGSDAADRYKNLVLQFVDLNTLGDRLDKKSIACDYMSVTNGWCQARFFAMDREKGEPLKKTIFTLQYINDEKLEMDRIEESILEKRESETLETAEREYLFHDLIQNIEVSVLEIIENKKIEFQSDISPKIPEKLYGDDRRIFRITEFVISNTLYSMEEGVLKLAVFAKETGDKVHLLVSVNVTGQQIRFDENNPGFRLLDALLEPMDSKLHIIREEEGIEAYYEMEQIVCDEVKVGE